MKYLITFLLMLNVALSVDFSPEATVLSQDYPKLFQESIVEYSISKWGDDLNMVISEINTQTKYFFEVLITPQNILFPDSTMQTKMVIKSWELIIRWSQKGYENHNRKIVSPEYIVKHLDEVSTDIIAYMLQCHTDWEMVKVELDEYYDNYLKLEGLK